MHSDNEEDLILRRECWWYERGGPGGHITKTQLKSNWGAHEVQRSTTYLTVVIPLAAEKSGSMVVIGYDEAPFTYTGARAFMANAYHETGRPAHKITLFYGYWVSPRDSDLRYPSSSR